MQERRLIISLTVAIIVPFIVLGLLLPTPSWAIDPNSAAVSILGTDCAKVTVRITRNPTTNDGGSGFDYYRIVISDNTGATLLVTANQSTFGSGLKTITGTAPLAAKPGGTSLIARMYDQTTFNTSDPNGPLLATSSPFSFSCNGQTSGSLGVNYYPPDNRVMASVKQDTGVYGTPDTRGPVVATLKAGQTWFVTGPDSTGRFYQVFLAGPELGWVKASDMALQGPLPVNPSATTNGAATNNNNNGGSNFGGNAVITAYTLRIHTGPGMGSPQIGLAYQGDSYSVYDQRGVWLLVKGPGGAGWVHGDWVKFKGSGSPPSATAGHPPANVGPLAGVVLAYSLRLRTGPNLNSAQLGTAHVGETYAIIGQSPNGTWLNVAGSGGSGWVDGSFMRILGSRSLIPVIR